MCELVCTHVCPSPSSSHALFSLRHQTSTKLQTHLTRYPLGGAQGWPHRHLKFHYPELITSLEILLLFLYPNLEYWGAQRETQSEKP